MTQGYKISWSTLLPSHRACHFVIHPLRVKRILPSFIGLCRLSWPISPSLALSDLIVPHEYFLIICWCSCLYKIDCFQNPVQIPGSSKKSPWTLHSAQNPENTSPSANSVYSGLPWEERLVRGRGTWQKFFFSLRRNWKLERSSSKFNLGITL